METPEKQDANLLYAGNAFYVQFVTEGKEDLVFEYENIAQIGLTVASMLSTIKHDNINILNQDSFKFFNESIDNLLDINESYNVTGESMSPEQEAMLEFEMFDVTRRDITSFSDFLKKAGDIRNVVQSGKDLGSRKFQLGLMHEIQRDPTFKHPAFDNLYKSFGEKDPKKRKEQEGGNYTTPGAYPAAAGGF